MAKALVERTSFAAGEVSPALYARRELATHAIGVARAENVVALIEGVLTRRPGTRFVLPYKNEAQLAATIRFRHTPEDGYLIVLNGGVMRVLKNGGFLESSPGVPYELAIPWASADLANIRWRQVENVVYITCTGYQTRVLTRGSSHTDWTLSLYLPLGGPVKAQNVDTAITITASAVTGAGITLAGVGTTFAANDVGGVFRLDEPDLTKVPQWTPNETLQAPQTMLGAGLGTNIGDVTANGGLAAGFDGGTNQVAALCAARNPFTDAYLGKDYGAGNEKKIAKAIVYGASDVGFYNATNHAIELRLYGKNGAVPANGTDGVELGRITFTDTNDESAGRTIFSNDAQTAWRHVWVYLKVFQAAAGLVFAELQLFAWTSPTPANLRRHNGRVYSALNDGDTGTNPPTHDEGDARSGNFNINWRFLHNTYGMVRVTSVASATSATGDVILRLPESVVEGPTYRWWPPAWSPREGWPDRIGMSDDGRLIFGRRNEGWITKPSDINSIEVLNITGDAADPDSGIVFRMRPRKSELPHIEWILSFGVIIFGLRDGERVMRAPQLFDPLAIDKLRLVPGTKEGSAAHEPEDVDSGVIWIGRSRRRLHYADFDNLSVRMATAEITKSARHILKGKASSLAWQRDPHRILWIGCQDGSFRGLTFMPEDKVVAFHRHVMVNGFVEWVASVPSADESTDEVYVGVRRTINGATRRYVERLQDFFEPADEEIPTALGAWFVDCGLRYQGVETSTITGLGHLIGQTVRVFANGAQQSDKIVSGGGSITLDAPVTDAIVGLPVVYRVRSLPFNLDTPAGSTKGQEHVTNQVSIETVHSAGGTVSSNGGKTTPLTATGGLAYGSPIKLVTDLTRYPVSGKGGKRCFVEISGDNALPFTLAGMHPELEAKG